ncbi:autotransporter outer membrane beta-barrel domain-containing protein, partial [Devosia insulae]|uniref:autotransporter outer membrane beta-barrel domain-containing protein n=1 Tax=Devosia insulae TaxID=408174 RepID=UPI00114C8EFF
VFIGQLARPAADSVKVEELQDQFTPIVARNSGRAITSAVMKGIALGFGGGGPTANVGLAAESAFLAYTPEAAVTNAFDGFDGPGFLDPAKQWSLWLDVQGSGLISGGSGQQLNLTGGIGYRFSEDFIAGIIGGQESFRYSADGDGLLSGSGLSAGGYVAWRFAEHGTLDAALVGTALGYEVSSGTATGQFDASRWLVTSGLTGEFELGDNLTISPSARVTALWENQEGWTDSLATEHPAKAFSDGTASGGVTISGQWLVLEDMPLLPYFGLFADYRFDAAEGTTSSGLEGRVQAGIRLNLSPSAAINLGGELGGLFSDQRTWSLNAGVSGGF